MKILGIDPGVATVGFGLVESSGMHQRMISCGVITTPAHTPLSSRLDRIYSDLEELIRSCNPDAISIEELFFSKNITTGIPVALPAASYCSARFAAACRCMSIRQCR